MPECSLNKIPIGKTVIIKEISSLSPCRLRLLDIGITPSTPITPIFKSPLNNPKAYLIKGTVIALRDEETGYIKVLDN